MSKARGKRGRVCICTLFLIGLTPKTYLAIHVGTYIAFEVIFI